MHSNYLVGKLILVLAILLVSPRVVADDGVDDAINLDDSSYDDNPSYSEPEDTQDIVRDPAQFYTPEHPQEITNQNQATFVAPPPTVADEKPYTPEKLKKAREFKGARAPKDSGVTIHFADEQAAETKRQQKEKELLQKFYQMEAKKKQMKASKKQPAKKKFAKKASRYKKITRR